MKKKIIYALLIAVFTVAMIISLSACTDNYYSHRYTNAEYSVSEICDSVEIQTKTYDIDFIASDEENVRVLCSETKGLTHSVETEDGKLVIKTLDTRRWYQKIIDFPGKKITVFLPYGAYKSLIINNNTGKVSIPSDFSFENINISLSTGDVTNCASASESLVICTNTGSVNISNVHAGDINVSVSTGEIVLENITCNSLNSIGSTGKASVKSILASQNISVTRSTGDIDINNCEAKNIYLTTDTGDISLSCATASDEISLSVSTGKTTLDGLKANNIISKGDTGKLFMTDVIAEESFSIERSTGDVVFENCDANEITINVDTGDVEGSFLSQKIFITETSTGKIRVPDSTSGGYCKISTSTGNITISYSK